MYSEWLAGRGAAELNRRIREILAEILTFKEESVESSTWITERRKIQEEKTAT